MMDKAVAMVNQVSGPNYRFARNEKMLFGKVISITPSLLRLLPHFNLKETSPGMSMM